MAATVDMERHTGARSGDPGVGTTRTTIAEAGTTRLSMSDSASPGSANPIPVPGSGSTRSWYATLGLNVTVAPTGVINNQQVWFASQTAIATGVTMDGQAVLFAASGSSQGYDQATGTTTQGDTLNTTNYPGLTGAPVTDVVTNWTAAAKKTLAGSISATTGRGSLELLAIQLVVGTTAGAGTLTAKTISWSYDET